MKPREIWVLRSKVGISRDEKGSWSGITCDSSAVPAPFNAHHLREGPYSIKRTTEPVFWLLRAIGLVLVPSRSSSYSDFIFDYPMEYACSIMYQRSSPLTSEESIRASASQLALPSQGSPIQRCDDDWICCKGKGPLALTCFNHHNRFIKYWRVSERHRTLLCCKVKSCVSTVWKQKYSVPTHKGGISLKSP